MPINVFNFEPSLGISSTALVAVGPEEAVEEAVEVGGEAPWAEEPDEEDGVIMRMRWRCSAIK